MSSAFGTGAASRSLWLGLLFLVLAGVQPGMAQPHDAASLASHVELAPGGECLDFTRLIHKVSAFRTRSELADDLLIQLSERHHPHHAIEFRIQQHGRRRTRVFDPAPERCDEAHSVLALALALALDDGALETFVTPGAPRPRPGLLLEVQPAFGFDLVPRTALGGSVGAALARGPWSLRFELFSLYGWGARIGPARGRFRALLAAAAVGGCLGMRPLRGLGVALCLSIAPGLEHARGDGFARSLRDTAPWVALLAGVRFEFGTRLPWLLDIELGAPLYAASVRVEREGLSDLVRTRAPVGLLVRLGPAFRVRR